MTYKTTGITFIVIGVLLLLGSLAADSIGGHTGFGRYQAIGMTVGIVIAGLGVDVFRRQ